MKWPDDRDLDRVNVWLVAGAWVALLLAQALGVG
jgi:hypothetical protein